MYFAAALDVTLDDNSKKLIAQPYGVRRCKCKTQVNIKVRIVLTVAPTKQIIAPTRCF